MRLSRRTLRTGAVVLCTFTVSCSAQGTTTLTQEERGAILFASETFDGNGRVCSTCHDLAGFGTITPESARELYRQNPGAPLFRRIDSDDGLGVSWQRLTRYATIRVPIELGTHGTGVSVRKCNAPEETTAVFNRGVPTTFNVALESFLMSDGREEDDLERQALNAIHTHGENGREPTADELAAIAAFEKTLFSQAGVKRFLETGVGLTLPDGSTPSEVRGRQFFEPNRQCGICHSGPMLNQASELHPSAAGSRFESVLVGAEPDNPNEKFYWCFVDPVTNRVVPGPAGDTAVFPAAVSDPGHALVVGERTFTGDDGIVRTVSSDVFVSEVQLPLFKIPTLWGTPQTAPYFHDNSAADLDEVLDQYNFMFRTLRGFAVSAGCDPDADDCLSVQARTDIMNYLQLLSFEGTGVRPDGEGRSP